MTSLTTAMAPPAPKGSPTPAAREALLIWFRAEDPGYPWRRDGSDPYAVLVSEVMLQQTQASRVAALFPSFLKRFPTVDDLAAASPADVIRAWAGLGYNRRAVALHRAARAVVDAHGGCIPADPGVLRTLPGVGPYTAAAVASIAYGRRAAAVDVNARRVIARLAFGAGEPTGASVRAAAERWVHPRAPGEWNQAVMNLGRSVCRRDPNCSACPLRSACRYAAWVGVGSARIASDRSGPVREATSRRVPSPFEGSTRQLRGAIVRTLRVRSSSTVALLARELGRDRRTIDEAAAALERDGLVQRTRGGRLQLQP